MNQILITVTKAFMPYSLNKLDGSCQTHFAKADFMRFISSALPRTSFPPASNDQGLGPTAEVPASLARRAIAWNKIESAALQAFLGTGTIPSSRNDRLDIMKWCVLNGETEVLECLLVKGNLKQLTIFNTTITEAAAQCLAEILNRNTHVAWLNLHCCTFATNSVQLIAEALRTNTTLLHLDCYRLPPNGALAIAEALKFNRTLAKLDLGGNILCLAEAHAIADLLKWNDTLTTLGLGSVGLKPDGIAAIAAVLSVNTGLAMLQIGGNCIDPVGLRALVAGLENNSTLTSIAISHNGGYFNDAFELDAGLFNTLLRTNSTLTSVNLEGNTSQLDQAGIAALARNKQFVENRTRLVGAGRGFAASLPLELPGEIGARIARLLVRDVVGCRAAVALTGLNKACRTEPENAAGNADSRLPGPRLQ